MNELWDILELSPTNDLALIKKAYARKLKIYHPEDDPVGYQNLREAYDKAIRYAKSSTEDDYEENNILIKEANHTITTELIAEENNFDYELNQEFMKEIEKLYSNFSLRIDIQNWINLFDCQVIWNIYNRKSIGDRMLAFLSYHRNLPQDIWIFLDLNFNWSSEETYNEEEYQDTIDYIEGKIQQVGDLGYHFKEEIVIDYDAYLELRDQAYSYTEENDLFMAYRYLDKVKEIYPSDPDLLLIEGKCLLHKGRDKEALKFFDDLLVKIPNHVEGLLNRSDLYRMNGKYDLAIDDLIKIEASTINNKEVLYRMALCYKELKDFQLAKDYSLRVLDTKTMHWNAIDLIKEINKSMIWNLRFKIIINPIDKSQWKQYRILSKEMKRSKESFIKKLKKTITLKRLLTITFLTLLLFAMIRSGYYQLSGFVIIVFGRIIANSFSK